MTILAQTGLLITEIPYRPDTAHYVEQLIDLPGCIFFDSGHPDAERGRYDIFSAAPLYSLTYKKGYLTRSGCEAQQLNGAELTAKLNRLLKEHLLAAGEPFAALASNDSPEPRLPFYGGFAGYFSYDLARCWEKLPEAANRDIDIPELMLGFYPWAGVVDHQLKKAWISILPDCPQALRQTISALLNGTELKNEIKSKFNIINKLISSIDVTSYKNSIAKIQQYIINGDCYQVNYAQRFSGSYIGHPWAAYKNLRLTMAAPYGAYFQFKSGKLGEDSAILSYSPERFIQVSDRTVTTQPIKGTIKRHTDPDQDKVQATTLLNSEKDKAENLMIVDLLRNDLGRSCEYGSVTTEKLFELQSVSNVHHLVSSISARLREGLTVFDLLQAMLPGGSITGAPKIRSMEIIEELEPTRRSIYCGVMGYINLNGDMDSNIAIRTVLCDQGKVYCWGGGGIVADSQWEQEYEESLVKIDTLLRSLEKMT